jgi:hypothetical protein
MHIDIHDPALEARMQRQIQAAGGSIDEAMDRLLRRKEEQDRWLLENGESVNAKIQRGLEQLDRGEGIPADDARARLKTRKQPGWKKTLPGSRERVCSLAVYQYLIVYRKSVPLEIVAVYTEGGTWNGS